MYFVNPTTKAVTNADIQHLFDVCTLLKSQCLIDKKLTQTNKKWRFEAINCHSLTRFISIVFKELKVVDGTLVGLEIDLDANRANIKRTNHSWLETPDGNIIDPYPQGIISTTSALLIPTSGTCYCVHGGNLYQKELTIEGAFDLTEAWKIARSRFRTMKTYLEDEQVAEAAKGLV